MLIISDWFKENIDGEGTLVVDLEATEKHFTETKCPRPYIFWQSEPDKMMPKIRPYILENYHLYDWVMTSDQPVLTGCPNSVYFNGAENWVTKEEYESIDVSKKQYKISTIVGGKTKCPGHILRLTLCGNIAKIRNLDVFHSSQCPPTHLLKNPRGIIYETKMPLFENYKYSLVIENSQQINYFTEKLIDCLLTKTLPIYYGCPNICEFFNTTGWVILPNTDVHTCVTTINSLSDCYYGSIDAIEQNYCTARRYLDGKKRLAKLVHELQHLINPTIYI